MGLVHPDVQSAFEVAERLQDHLGSHFREVQRRKHDQEVFVIEHGLNDGELSILRKSVGTLVRHTQPWKRVPLPFLVYATEVGYSYDGEEYWESFRALTPPGFDAENRQKLRSRFELFCQDFGGARPSGVWADQYSIISWPVTHSLLPKVFQKQLAELLFQNKYELSSRLLEEPSELGLRLQVWGSNSSARFRELLQNHDLLGQISVGLLHPESQEVTGIIPATIARILTDLETERQARTWLRGAQSAVTTVSKQGFQRPVRSAPEGEAIEKVQITLRAVRVSDGTWRVYAELPDLSPLLYRFSELENVLKSCRTRLAGSKDWLARSTLLRPGRRVALEAVAVSGGSLEIEGAPQKWSSLVGDYCVLPEPPWLFRISVSEGTHIRSLVSRPGFQYLLIGLPSDSGVDNAVQAGIVATGMAVAGERALLFDLADTLTGSVEGFLSELGLSSRSVLNVWPAGLPNAGWDGESEATWLSQEPFLLAISTNGDFESIAVQIGDERVSMPMLPNQSAIVRFDDLPVGLTKVKVTASHAATRRVTEGLLCVRVLDRHRRSHEGSLREVFSIEANPTNSTLDELVSGMCTLRLVGPKGLRVTGKIQLFRSRNEVPTFQSQTRDIVLSSESTDVTVDVLELLGTASRSLHEADSVRLEFEHGELGISHLKFERPFQPVRLFTRRVSQDLRRIIMRNQTEHVIHEIEFSPANRPFEHTLIPFDEEGLPIRTSGLATVQVKGQRFSLIAHPSSSSLENLGGGEIMVPHVTKTIEDIRNAVTVARNWSDARTEGLLEAETKRRVIARISSEIACSICGSYWRSVERSAQHREVDDAELVQAFGGPNELSTAHGVLRALRRSDGLSDFRREFDELVSRRLPSSNGRPLLPEFVLRLSMSPDSTASLEGDVFNELLDLTFNSPVLLRMARLASLKTAWSFAQTAGALQ